jgi:hypothetical protein
MKKNNATIGRIETRLGESENVIVAKKLVKRTL